MRVADAQRASTSIVRPRRERTEAGGDAAFVKMLDSDTASAAGKAEAAPLLNIVGNLLPAQSVDDAAARRAKHLRRGQSILDQLERIRAGLICGAIPGEHLNALIRAVKAERTAVTDPRLKEVLDEIDLRAQVELAKLSIEL